MIGALATLILLPLFLYALLRTSPVQTLLSRKAATYLSSELGTTVEVGGLDIKWFFNLTLTDLRLLDKRSHTLLAVKEFGIRVEKLSLRSQHLILKKVVLEKADVNLIHYLNDSSLNLQFIVDYFSSSDTTTSPGGKKWKIACKNLEIDDSHFLYRDERYLEPGKGIDYSDLDLANLNLSLSDIHLIGDSIFSEIKHLSVKEKSGFSLQHLSAQAIVSSSGFSADSLKIVTDHSSLSLDLKMLYTDWTAFDDFLDSVTIVSTIRPSKLDMRDIVFFAPEIDGMSELFDLSGQLKGKVTSFSGKNMSIGFGDSTLFKGTIKMAGLPDIEETFVMLKLDDFRTNARDIQNFTLPYNEGKEKIVLPAEISRLGKMNLKGKFTGFYNDFVSNSTLTTDLGSLSTDVLLNNDKKQHIIGYKGHVQATGFNIGKVFNLKELGAVSLTAEVDGKGLTAAKADLVVKGDITEFQVMGNSLNHIRIDGSLRNKRFDGILQLRDELAQLDFNGDIDLSDTIPAFNFKADLRDALLTRLNIWDRDSTSSLSTHMDLDFKGNSLDNLLGSLEFSNTVYHEGNQMLKMNDLLLRTQMLSHSSKRMSLSSDFVDATFTGQYTLDDLSEYLTFVFTDYLPGLSLVSPNLGREEKGSFEYTIQLKNTAPLTNIFLPELAVDRNTVISGIFDPAVGLINVNGSSPMIRLNGFTFHDWSIQGNTSNGELALNMNCSSLDLSDSSSESESKLERFGLSSITRNDSVRFRIYWNDLATDDQNRADIGGAISFSDYPKLNMKIDSASVLINDTLWNATPGNLVTIDSTSFEIRNLQFVSANMGISVDGKVSRDPLDQLKFNFHDLDISQFDVITEHWGIDFDGKLNGTMDISDIYNVPLINASLVLKNMGFNHEQLGDAEIISSWDNKAKAVAMDFRIAYHGTAGLHYPLLAKGYIYPEREHNNLDFNVKLDNIKLKILQPFFTGLFSRMKGWGSGELELKGDFEDPVLAGSIKMMRSELLVDYLRTTYSFTGDLNFGKDLMWFKDVKLADSLGNTGQASGTIKHHAFDDWYLDLHIDASGLSVLNTNYNPDEMYYGKARVIGDMSLTGPINDLRLSAKATSAKGTEVFIPLDYAVDISENDYITYVSKDTSNKDMPETHSAPSNLSLKLGLNVTKDASMVIILPYRMGNIKVRGDGLIDLGIDTRGDYSMHGVYVMDKGSFLFNLQDLFSRNFEIRKGSTITFNGSPDDADINLQAVYKMKTNLAGLGSIPAEIASRRIPVDCIISLNNSLYNPDIHFSISMPEADVETQRLVYGAIDTSNAVAMNKQMISLLVLNSFTSANENANLNAAGLGISSFGLISGQLNNWLSQISKDFDIGVNYRPGDQVTAEELELALSTQLFNDRVVIDGAIGRSGSNSQANTQANQWIGDVNVEVKITEDGRFRVKAFNRTNTSLDLYTGQAPYTQGVGVLYRKEFDYIKDLFRKQRKSVITE